MRRRVLTASLRLALVVGLAAGCAKGEASAGDGGPDASADHIDGGGGGDPDADTCAGDPCGLLEQCGCGAAQVCDIDYEADDGTTACRDVVVPGDERANCDGPTGCGAGFTCTGSDQCRRYCDGPEDCAAGGECFFQQTDADGDPIPEARLCTKPCTPEAATGNGCPDDPQLACRVLFLDPDEIDGSGDEHFQTDCGIAGAGGDGADCAAAGEPACRAGFGCFQLTTGETTSLECKQVCVWESAGAPGPRACAIGTCTELLEPIALVGTIEYGACL